MEQQLKYIPPKAQRAIEFLQKCEKLAMKINPEGFILCFSGGKDSQCIYHLAKAAGVKFKALYNLTTVDPPPTCKIYQTAIPRRNSKKTRTDHVAVNRKIQTSANENKKVLLCRVKGKPRIWLHEHHRNSKSRISEAI